MNHAQVMQKPVTAETLERIGQRLDRTAEDFDRLTRRPGSVPEGEFEFCESAFMNARLSYRAALEAFTGLNSADIARRLEK